MVNELHDIILRRKSILVRCAQQQHWSPLLLNHLPPLSVVVESGSFCDPRYQVPSWEHFVNILMNTIGYLTSLNDLVYILFVLQAI